MATSGTYTFSRNRDQLLRAALLKIGAIEATETPDSSMIADAAVALNAMVKHWQGQGIHIWTTAEATLFLQANQVQYTLSTTSTDHCTESFTETALTAAALTSATTITVGSITAISSGDNIGIQVDDGTIHWTTVNGAPSGSTVTLTTGLDDSASIGGLVVAYTSNIVRPLKILSARRYNFTSGLDTPIMVEDRKTYFDLPNKTNSGMPNMVFYDRRGGANATGILHVWQPQAPPTEAIKFTWARPIQDFNAAGDDADFPQEWEQTLIYNLADILTDDYDTPPGKVSAIHGRAIQYLADMQWNETELETIEFAPAFR